MVKRAGCASLDCPCHISSGTGVRISGVGSASSPFVLSTAGYQAALKGMSTEDVTVTVIGAGTADSPYSVSAVVYDTSLPFANAQQYTASGTWVKPPGASMVLVTVIGAGGGGAAGAGGTGTNAVPGQGGGGGGWSQFLFHASWLPATVPVTVGIGGTGGVGVTNSAYGNGGVRGGNSSFGPYLLAGGGEGGTWSDDVPREIPLRSIGVESGGPAHSNIRQAGESTFKAGAGGGVGGEYGSMVANDLFGGEARSYSPTAPLVPPSPTGSNPGTPAPVGSGAGGGGGQGGWGYVVGGGPGGADVPAQSGQAGGYPGGGGGGGGKGRTATPTPGSGGRGANGWVEVVTW